MLILFLSQVACKQWAEKIKIKIKSFKYFIIYDSFYVNLTFFWQRRSHKYMQICNMEHIGNTYYDLLGKSQLKICLTNTIRQNFFLKRQLQQSQLLFFALFSITLLRAREFLTTFLAASVVRCDFAFYTSK